MRRSGLSIKKRAGTRPWGFDTSRGARPTLSLAALIRLFQPSRLIFKFVGLFKQAMKRGLVSRSFRQSTAVFGTLPVICGVTRHYSSNALVGVRFRTRTGAASLRSAMGRRQTGR